MYKRQAGIVDLLNKTHIKSLTILGANNALCLLKNDVQALSVNWIKAHNGFEGNELADEYAKQGAIEAANIYNTPLTKNELKKASRRRM